MIEQGRLGQHRHNPELNLVGPDPRDVHGQDAKPKMDHADARNWQKQNDTHDHQKDIGFANGGLEDRPPDRPKGPPDTKRLPIRAVGTIARIDGRRKIGTVVSLHTNLSLPMESTAISLKA
jgi:hypothetical protein